MLLEHISHSRLQTFEQCPRKYRFRYDDKIPSPIPKEPYLDFGNFIHKLFELVLKGSSYDEAFQVALKEYHGFPQAYHNRIGDILQKFKTFNEQIEQSGPISQSAEEKFNLFVGKSTITVTGTIDRKIRYDTGKILIVDYKTSQKRNQVPAFMINHDKQLMTYIWATSKTEGVEMEDISGMLFYVESGDKLVAKPDPREITLHMFQCDNLAKRILATKPENVVGCTSKLCNYCEYRSLCPDFKQNA
jgi:putative RecB family exonuclease